MLPIPKSKAQERRSITANSRSRNTSSQRAGWQVLVSIRDLHSSRNADKPDNLIPFTRWITPPNVPKRFTTQMYLYFLPLPSESSAPQNNGIGPIPTDSEKMIAT